MTERIMVTSGEAVRRLETLADEGHQRLGELVDEIRTLVGGVGLAATVMLHPPAAALGPVREALDEYADLDHRLRRIESELAGIAVDMYEDARWEGVEHPLEERIDGETRWRMIALLDDERTDALHGIMLWRVAHPEAAADLDAEEARLGDRARRQLADAMTRLEAIASGSD